MSVDITQESTSGSSSDDAKNRPDLKVTGWRVSVHETVPLVVPPHLFKVWFELEGYAGKSQTCWPSDGTLSAELGVSVGQVQRHLQRLEDLGVIDRETVWKPAHHDGTRWRSAARRRTIRMVRRIDQPITAEEWSACEVAADTRAKCRAHTGAKTRANTGARKGANTGANNGVHAPDANHHYAPDANHHYAPDAITREGDPGNQNQEKENQGGVRPPRGAGGALSHDRRRIEEGDRKRLQEWVEGFGDDRLVRVLPGLLRTAAAVPGVADPALLVAAAIWGTQAHPGSVQDDLARSHLSKLIAGEEPRHGQHAANWIKVAEGVLGRKARKAEEAAILDYLDSILVDGARHGDGDVDVLQTARLVAHRHGWRAALITSAWRGTLFSVEEDGWRGIGDYSGPDHWLAALEAGDQRAWDFVDQKWRQDGITDFIDSHRDDPHPGLAKLMPHLDRPVGWSVAAGAAKRLAALDAQWDEACAADIKQEEERKREQEEQDEQEYSEVDPTEAPRSLERLLDLAHGRGEAAWMDLDPADRDLISEWVRPEHLPVFKISLIFSPTGSAEYIEEIRESCDEWDDEDRQDFLLPKSLVNGLLDRQGQFQLILGERCHP